MCEGPADIRRLCIGTLDHCDAEVASGLVDAFRLPSGVPS